MIKSCRLWMLCATLLAAAAQAIELREDGYHVFPGDNIQEALEMAAQNRTNKTVQVHSGEYRPKAKRQAMIWFNKKHDGVRLLAKGEVTLTAANPELSLAGSRSFPAVVNHVVYFGDGISSNTLLRGFRITGANNYITDKFTQQMEPDTSVPKNSFFITDGGAIKIFGRSYPIIDRVEVSDNYASPCGGGISVQQQGYKAQPVVIMNSIFRNNRAQVTGAAIDLLEGSSARIINCLFIGNASNLGPDVVARKSGEPPFTNSGVLTIFQNSKAEVINCTFTGNRNAVDDLAEGNVYRNCIFYRNDLNAGYVAAPRYELDLRRKAVVEGCLISGPILDPSGSISEGKNKLRAASPDFDARHVPKNLEYKNAGFRPPP